MSVFCHGLARDTESVRNEWHKQVIKKKFTLIELLVVIAIIAILFSLLFPGLARAKKYAELVSCASNLRQINVSLFLFAGEHKGHFPWFWRNNPFGATPLSPVATNELPYPVQTAAAYGGCGSWSEAIGFGFGSSRLKQPLTCPAMANLYGNATFSGKVYGKTTANPIYRANATTSGYLGWNGPYYAGPTMYSYNDRLGKVYSTRLYSYEACAVSMPRTARISQLYRPENVITVTDYVLSRPEKLVTAWGDAFRTESPSSLNAYQQYYPFNWYHVGNVRNFAFADGSVRSYSGPTNYLNNGVKGPFKLGWLLPFRHDFLTDTSSYYKMSGGGKTVPVGEPGIWYKDKE
jgi:prepilin-type N-terminal cleavage/methylation domain-containing protein/prepilin-type processing-associated H-X9-DG protein